MLIVADTHVHVYRGYDVALALRSALENLTRLAGGADDALPVLFLTEAAGSDFFEELRQGKLAGRLPGWSVEPAGREGGLWLEPREGSGGDASAHPARLDGRRLLLVAGRQVVTEERLEVLALATQLDGGPSRARPRVTEAIETVRAAAGVPVLSWAPGKWSFGRGRVVASIIETARPGELLVGDTSLRASAAEPPLMRRARRRGLQIVAGSDPLPIGGEERILGSYGITWQGEIDISRPLDSLRAMLLDPSVAMTAVGERSSYAGVMSRLARHMLASTHGRKHA